MLRRGLSLWSWIAALSSCSGQASAEGVASRGDEAAPGQAMPRVVDSPDGLPGIYRVGVPGTPAPRAGGNLFLQYGYTEPQNGEADGHQRFGATASVGGAFVPYLAGAVRIDFRYDIHGTDSIGGDSGSVLDVTPLLRSGFVVAPWLHIGAEMRLAFSGATVGTGIAAPSLDGRFLATTFLPDGYTVAGLGGVRSAQTGSALEDSTMLRPGDRVVLGVSEFPAVLMGLAVMKDFGPSSVFLEGTWDLLVGSGAPPPLESPLRIDLGARYRILDGMDLQAIFEVSPGGRAPSQPGDPLVPIEPRLSGLLGLSIRLPDLTHRSEPPPPEQKPAPEAQENPVTPAAAPVIEDLPAPMAGLEVVVVDETGHPISDARVFAEIPATKESEAEVRELPLGEVNVYALTDLPVGAVEVSVEAELLQSYRQEVTLVEGEPQRLEVRLRKAVGGGSQLRGLVRAYSGAGVPASIRVAPGDYETTCDASGQFSLDLPPGDYSVMIEAEGYAPQKRRLRVRKESVTVLNADLQREN